MVGAPVRPREPPAITTTPDLNLLPSRGRCGTSSSTRRVIRPAFAGSGAPRGTPIATISTAPEWNVPGATWSPTFEPWKVPMASALTASPSISPVVAFTPDGTSQASTGTSSTALMASMADLMGWRGSPSKPVPSMASTIAPERARRSGSKGSGGLPGRRSRFVFASPFSSAGSPAASTSTSRPSSRSSRATTRPSPPLLPLPTTTRTGPGRARSATIRASPIPARSIRSSDGTPCSSIAHLSTARISSASYSGSSQSGSAIAARGYLGSPHVALVSVVIPTRDRQAMVAGAVRSALDQSGVSVEVCVVDDGSQPPVVLPDDLAADGQVKVIRLDRPEGAGAARNAGLAATSAEVVAFLDDDDVWLPGKLARQLAALDDESVAVACGFEVWDGATLVASLLPPNPFEARGLLAHPLLWPSTVVVRRAALETAGPFDETLQRVQDWDLWLRLADLGRVDVVSEVLVDRRWSALPPETARAARAMVAPRIEERLARLPVRDA